MVDSCCSSNWLFTNFTEIDVFPTRPESHQPYLPPAPLFCRSGSCNNINFGSPPRLQGGEAGVEEGGEAVGLLEEGGVGVGVEVAEGSLDGVEVGGD